MKKTYISPVCNFSNYSNYSCESLICTSPIHFPKEPKDPDPEETDDNWSKRRNMYSGYAADNDAPTDAAW